MRSTVLLPLDGSDRDRRAIPVAAAIAELASAGVRIVRVLENPAESSETDLRDAARQLDELVQSPTTWEVLDNTDVAAALLRDIEVHGAQFVVVATRASGALGRAIHGSVADRLVRESPQPIVLVPPRADHLGGKRLRLRRILVPLDGSAASLGAITHLMRLPRAHELECVLIRAVDQGDIGEQGMPSGMSVTDHPAAEQAERELNDVAERLRQLGATVEVRVVESNDASSVILDAVRNDLVELIVMTTHGLSGLTRLVLGSVAKAVVRASEIPVMLITRPLITRPRTHEE